MKRNQPNQVIDLGKDVLAQDYSETVFLIGRSKECHVVLDDKKISREHVRIIHKNAKWFLEKCNEENQCKINGENFNRHEIENGDILTVEQFSINFEESNGKIQNVLPASEKNIVDGSDLNPININKEIVGKQESQSHVQPSEKKSNATATDINNSQLKTIDDNDSTREINLDEIMNSEANSEYANAPDDDFEIDNTGTSSSIENQDQDLDDEIIISASEDVPNEDGENSSYSLENIDSDGDDESTRVMQSFATVHLELFGETAPYDKFIIEKDKTFIGRDPSKCQIVLNDSDVSTVHAVIVRNNIMITLEDLNSSNGTIYKGDRINKVILGHNDEFVIGGVSFTVKIRSEFLKDESSTLMAVDENQTVEVEEVVEIQAEDGEQLDALGEMVENQPQEKSIIKRILKDEAQRKKLIYGLVLLVGAWLFLGEEEQNTPEPKKTNTVKTSGKNKKKANKTASGKKLSEEQMRSLSATYEIGKGHFNNGRYREALSELQKIVIVDPNFNPNLQSLISLSKEGLSKIEEAEKERQAKIQAAERKAKVLSLLEKAKEYTKDRRVDIANATFNEITQLDPENFDVSRMKRELEDWQKEKQRKELEEVQKKKDREDKVEKLKPSRTLFLQNEWFKTINKIEEFLKIKEMDDDLTTEATTMLKKSKEELTASVSPLQGKAKSLLEGQDLKGAYEVYQQILKIEPSNSEALNQVGDIKEQLTNRARKIYREAIISESLSLFQDAKEKFQEVQQITPVDSEYYKKASDKLKDYLE